MRHGTKIAIAIAIAWLISAALFAWMLSGRAHAAPPPQTTYPPVTIYGQADAINGGLAQPIRTDNHGVLEGIAVGTFNAAQGNATASQGYQLGQPAPAWVAQIGEQAHIANTTATTVKGTTGILLNLVINGPPTSNGTVSIFDLAAAGCTGTPSTNTVAVLTVVTATQPTTISYGGHFTNGICVKSSVATDLTAVYQ